MYEETHSAMKEEYASLSKLLMEFVNISKIEKAWVCKSGNDSKAIYSASQPNILANSNRKFILSATIHVSGTSPVDFQWSPFPVEVSGASTILPSPSGSKLLIVRNSDDDSPTKFEIWGPSDLEKEFLVPQAVHGSLFTDAWFEGVSWNFDETLIAYVAEEPTPLKPTFNNFGYTSTSTSNKSCNSWDGQGDWEEGWGETYVKKRCPAIFVIDINSGEVRAVEGINKALSVGQVVWVPATFASQQHLVVVGWSAEPRKLGMKYCTNRPCALYAVTCPFNKLEDIKSDLKSNADDDSNAVVLTKGISSAFCPRFSPDGRFLVFLSAKSAVESGAHNAIFSLHRADWQSDGKPNALQIVDVVPVVMSAENGCFPGLYFPSILINPWLSDKRTMILSSIWRSTQVILSVDVESGNLSRITPHDSSSSWEFLSLDEDNIIAVCSSPVDIPQIKYGRLLKEQVPNAPWNWQDVPSPLFRCSKEVSSCLSSLQFCIMKIPVRSISENSTEGASKPFEAIFVSSTAKNDICNPLITVLHGGPHDVATSKFSKTLAFLASTGYNLLIVNYRGSLGFGEEALQSLPGNVGSQDVNDVLTAIDHVVGLKLAEPPRIAVFGGSHGGFLSAHLIGQAPEKFSVAAVWNPVCNLALMVGTTDIPDWCFVNAYGSDGKTYFTEAPSKDNLNILYDKSPISHVHKVKAPTLFLLGAQDLRVPVPDGLQYARALKERGIEVKVIMFPNDVHEISRPQSEVESFVNIALWFKNYCQ
ncbi:acylamino-acid-releasing enzyme 1-like isoform X1 [Chenopodium quinoa]|uniref:acylamino-acid-releasing enzyme 1-like isoform X1 n=1 Tax=Chenopodium quinoa TaxID=63459 RepID=UPI000B78D1C8|nr:acylamino-acid-releasing enzyme 1-like isoform X1 [Chenopodium quinoa]XP_021718421.1 acylamino-acid-releasing enzyme 1-like isoform X1 [Chenopodium quinoa]